VRCELVKCYFWSIGFYGAETWTLRKVGQKYLESFEIWWSRRMEKISWTDHVVNEILHKIKDERNVLHTVKRRNDNWISHILSANCLLKHTIEGNIAGEIDMTGRRERRLKQILDDLNETRRCLLGNCKRKHEIAL
jgi:hypothetical protein